ncbi:hypothetical protein pipiens_001631 [Culex pipiens pipiens]|uniref:proline--tRNA ligase n=1 Tax=Culex pipiens pipiens TaxID=38569 RepID=A0ABD1CEI7_CULPP
MNRLTKIFQPTLIVPKNAVVKNQDVTSKSQRLMLEQGLFRQAGNGTFYLMPLLQRSLQKAVDLVDHFMQRHASAQKLTLPMLTAASLWRQSGRLESAGPELMRTTDRHGKQQILGPTHEESITALVASISPVSYRAFPLRLYQISTKFRDEMKPRFGLMRAKEFLMKDLYTFDLFDAVGVGYVKVRGDTGMIGGSESHEYHFPSEVGRISWCVVGSAGWVGIRRCSGGVRGVAGPTKTMGAKFLAQNGKPETLQMGCYGIGVTRLLAAGVEVLSSEKDIRWPFVLAPFKVCLIPPKEGSKEAGLGEKWVEKLNFEIGELSGVGSDVLVDDRTNMTIGKRLMDARKTGYPIVVVIGPKTATESGELFEIHNHMDRSQLNLNFSETLAEIKRICDSQFSY